MSEATETNAPAIATEEKVVAAPEDAEARVKQLEEEKENYRKAYLKESELRKTRGENLKENKELKLALSNKTTSGPAAAIGTHSEAPVVQDTLVTNEQMAAFKAKGWSDKDIERYKQNLRKRM